MTKALDSALRLLARREHSANELAQKLNAKGFNPDEVQEALAACERMGLQSDQRFAESYSRSRIRQGYGPLKISQELKSRGLDSSLIHQQLRQEQHNWHDHAVAVCHKKCKQSTTLSLNERQKLQRFLLYRGFSSDVINRVMRDLG